VTVVHVLVGVLVYLAAYFSIGWYLARRDLPRAWAAARKEYTKEKYVLARVKEDTTATLFFWPVVLPVRAFGGAVEKTAVEHDPREKDRRIREQEKRIAELERELGIGRPQ